MKVKGGVWLVTGGASGLGEGTVRHLASLGGKVRSRHATFCADLSLHRSDHLFFFLFLFALVRSLVLNIFYPYLLSVLFLGSDS